MPVGFFGRTEREVTFVASPAGIFLETGTWFAIQEDALRDYARGVLNHYSLGRLLADADLWLRSPRTLALVMLPLLLVIAPVWMAVVASLVIFGLWYVFGPSLVNDPALALMRVLDHVMFQALLYVFILSILAGQGSMTAVWAGLAVFIAFRWGIIERIADRFLHPAVRAMYSLPLPDQVLRGVIMRKAIRLQIPLPQLGEMERRIRDRWASKQ